MVILNEKNIQTEQCIHIMITDKCKRNCPDCCNNQYSLNDIPVLTDDELRKAKRLYLTGGEPFAFADPCKIAYDFRNVYNNVERIVVYTNAYELYEYLKSDGKIYGIDGLTISIKTKKDKEVFESYLSLDNRVTNLQYNRVYVFEGFEDTICPKGFDKQIRKWQKDFVAAPNSIFRRLATVAAI